MRLAAGRNQPHRGRDLVRASGQTKQHGGGVRGVARLAEHLVVQDHFRIRAEHQGIRHRHDLQQAGARLLARHPRDIVQGRLARAAPLRHIEFQVAEIDPEAGQQFGSARGPRGKMQHADRITRATCRKGAVRRAEC